MTARKAVNVHGLINAPNGAYTAQNAVQMLTAVQERGGLGYDAHDAIQVALEVLRAEPPGTMTNRLRMPPVFPRNHVTAEMLNRFGASLSTKGISADQYYTEVTVYYAPEIEKDVVQASYDVVPEPA